MWQKEKLLVMSIFLFFFWQYFQILTAAEACEILKKTLIKVAPNEQFPPFTTMF